MRITAAARVEMRVAFVMARARYANVKSLPKAGALIRAVARTMITKSRYESAPGEPPHTRRGQLKRSILFQVESQAVVIGPTLEGVGLSATAQEFGGYYRGGRYPLRPFMGPALERTQDRLPAMWSGSIR